MTHTVSCHEYNNMSPCTVIINEIFPQISSGYEHIAPDMQKGEKKERVLLTYFDVTTVVVKVGCNLVIEYFSI